MRECENYFLKLFLQKTKKKEVRKENFYLIDAILFHSRTYIIENKSETQ